MAQIFKLLTPLNKTLGDDGVLKIAGYASTSDTDRVGDVIVPDAWTRNGGLNNFKKNPIILFNHNYQSPIGKATELEVDERGLKITCEISPSAGPSYGLIKDGVLTTFSVGFMIKDADYNSTTDGYIIRDAELLEVSVVSVPCNQEAVFSISKSLKPEELKEFKKIALKGHDDGQNETDGSTTEASPQIGTIVPPEIKVMNPEEIAALAAKAATDAIAAHEAARTAAAEKASKEAADKAAGDEAVKTASESAAKVAAEATAKSVTETMTTAFEKQLKENNDNWEKTLGEFKEGFEAQSAEFKKFKENKHFFGDRGNANWKEDKGLMKSADDAFILKLALNKSGDFLEATDFGKSVREKFNTQSTVTVGSDALETTVRTQIEQDIWNSLILAPLFPEIAMNSATMTFPIMPDAGYAEITSNTTASGTQPNGNMDPRGAGYGAPYQGLTLQSQTLSTIKMISKSYLGNETEEDAILPILPLIRDSMIRAHQRGVENMLLSGNYADGVYTTGAANGLLNFASTGGRTVTASTTTTKLTSAALFGLRKLMGKYGLDPRDIVYIVSQQAYFELIEDAEFADADLVGSQANKLTGEVGKIYGSSVLMCDEFATPAAGRYFALALNKRNFLVPRLRGVTAESEYQVENQRTALVTSQRLGFAERIPGATSVIGLKYAAS